MRVFYRLGFMMLFLPFLVQCSKADVVLVMEKYLWEKRVLLIFAPNTNASFLQKQNAILKASQDGLLDRDMVVWRFVQGHQVSVDQAQKPHLATKPFYEFFKVNPQEFTVILLGKDGDEKLRKTSVLSSGELFSLIDAMPMRQQEMRDKN